MSNPVFEQAIAAIGQHMAAVQAEIQRLAGVHDQMDALRVQQRDLQKTVNELAAKIPEHQRAIANAEASAKAVLDEASVEKAQIIANGKLQHRGIIDSALAEAKKIIEDAKQSASAFEQMVVEAKEELAAARDQIKIANSQVDAARNTFARLKQHAGAFASLED